MKKLLFGTLLGLLAFQGMAQEKMKKAIFVIVDGIPADVLDTVPTPYLDEIAAVGGLETAVMGGDTGTYSETPTISAVGYNTLLTGTWANKHNVWGNSIEKPNYNYYTIFRMYKEANPTKKAAIFSTWLDNRTKLVGAGLPETGNFTFDYFFDGFEQDTLVFPHDEDRMYIHLIDETVSKEAARYTKSEAPDLSWMYLEYSDDMGHRFGNSPQMIDGVVKADKQIGRVWEAIKYREENYNEDWLIVVTTDHGREDRGYHHGGQSERERTIWIATNACDINDHFKEGLEMVDILPSLAHHMGLNIPKKHAMELDGVSFIGELQAADLRAELTGDNVELTWKPYVKGKQGKIWLSTTNYFKEGGLDNYWYMGDVPLEEGKASFSLKGTKSTVYKVVLETPSGYLNYWIVNKEKDLPK